LEVLIVTNSHVTKLHFESTKISTKSTFSGKGALSYPEKRCMLHVACCIKDLPYMWGREAYIIYIIYIIY